jgi:hypothetical protein
MRKDRPKIGDLCRLANQRGVYKHGFNQHYYSLFDIRPELEDDIWVATGPTKRLGYVIANKDIFVLLEINEANDCQYPKVLTTTGLVGYLYLHNDNEELEKVEQ